MLIKKEIFLIYLQQWKSEFVKSNFHGGWLEKDAVKKLLFLEREIGFKVLQNSLVLQPNLKANNL